MKQVFSAVLLTVALEVAVLATPLQAIQEHGTAMLRDAEDMVMHGGMGDGGAIRHHCAEVIKHATAILNALPKGNEQGQAAAPLLHEAITHCKRVADMGDKVDPGASLNPATKARAAAKEAMKHLSAMRAGGG